MATKGKKTVSGEVFCWGAGRSNKAETGLMGYQSQQSCPLNVHGCYFASLKQHRRFFDEESWNPYFISSKSIGLMDQIRPIDPSTAFLPPNKATSISAGEFHSLAIFDGGKVTGWGSNQYLQILDHEGTILGLSDVIQVASGGEHSLALRADGTVVGWGGASAKTVGRVDKAFAVQPPKGLANVIQIAAGGSHSLALTKDGNVVGWGTKIGVLGEDFQQATVPKHLKNIIKIGAIAYGSWSISENGDITTWGKWDKHQVPPKKIPKVKDLAFGWYHGMALLEDGKLTSWGKGQNGKTDLGFRQRDEYAQATLPKELKSTVQISAGGWHSMALDSDGKVFCWGAGADNREGKDEKKQPTNEFKQATAPKNLPKIGAISAGLVHSMALSA